MLPGSKQVSGDLAWLKAQGLDAAIVRHARAGRPVLGICGGLQMLGEALIDTHGIDGNAPGLGLLPLVTTFEPAKTVRRTEATLGDCNGSHPSPWAALSGLTVAGYEIHHGQTCLHPAMQAAGHSATEVLPGLAWMHPRGHILGLYLHGLFEDTRVLQALFGTGASGLDPVFEGLADFIDTHFQPGVLDRLIHPPASP